MLVHNLVVTGSLTFPTALPISGSLLVSGSTTFNGTSTFSSPDLATDGLGNVNIFTTDAAAIGKGGSLSFGGGTTGGTSPYAFAKIEGVYNGSAAYDGTLIFSTNRAGTIAEKMRISNSGSVGIGTTVLGWDDALITAIQVRNSSFYGYDTNELGIVCNAQVQGGWKYISTGAASYQVSAGGGHAFYTAPSGNASASVTWTERFSISNAGTSSFSGNVGIGTTSPLRLLDVSTGSDTYLRVTGNRGNADNLHVGNLEFYNSFSTRIIAEIRGITGDSGTQSNSGQLAFYTNNAGSYTEKMRFNSKGYLKVTSTGTYNDLGADNHEFINGTINNNSFFVANTNTSYAGATLVRINCNRTTTNASYNLIGATNGNSTGEFLVRDSGNVQNTNNSYTGTSDIKLKQDIIDASSQWEDIKQMRIRKFRFKKQVEQDENAPYLLGVIAQELELVSPNLVDEALDFDGTGEEVISTTKSVKYSIIYMKAVKALQEAMAKIETLETTIETLTTRITALEN